LPPYQPPTAWNSPTTPAQNQTPAQIVSQITGQPSLVNISNTPITPKPAPGAPTQIGPGGFQYAGQAQTALPTADSLYALYKRISGGQDNEGMRQYLASPEFQAILQSGQVPMWMASDPVWRLYLMRLGVLNRLGQMNNIQQ
jgi:hypothetical protein